MRSPWWFVLSGASPRSCSGSTSRVVRLNAMSHDVPAGHSIGLPSTKRLVSSEPSMGMDPSPIGPPSAAIHVSPPSTLSSVKTSKNESTENCPLPRSVTRRIPSDLWSLSRRISRSGPSTSSSSSMETISAWKVPAAPSVGLVMTICVRMSGKYAWIGSSSSSG